MNLGQEINVFIDTYLYGKGEILNAPVHFESAYEMETDRTGVLSSSGERPLDPTGTFTDEQVTALRRALQIPDGTDAACVVNIADQTYWEGAGLSIIWVEFRSGNRIIASCYANLSDGQAVREIMAYTPG